MEFPCILFMTSIEESRTCDQAGYLYSALSVELACTENPHGALESVLWSYFLITRLSNLHMHKLQTYTNFESQPPDTSVRRLLWSKLFKELNDTSLRRFSSLLVLLTFLFCGSVVSHIEVCYRVLENTMSRINLSSLLRNLAAVSGMWFCFCLCFQLVGNYGFLASYDEDPASSSMVIRSGK